MGSCDWLCRPRSKHRRLVNPLYPKLQDEGIVRGQLGKLLEYCVEDPDQRLSKVAVYIENRIIKDTRRGRNGYVNSKDKIELARSHVIVGLTIFGELLRACHSELNLLAPHILPIILMLLEGRDPELKIHATELFRQYANYHQEVSDLHGRWDAYVGLLIVMVWEKTEDIVLRRRVRLTGILGLRAIIRMVNVLGTHFHEQLGHMVPALLHTALEGGEEWMGDKANLLGVDIPSVVPVKGDSGLKDADVAITALDCLRDIAQVANASTAAPMMVPLLRYFNENELWNDSDVPIHTLQKILQALSSSYRYIPIESLIRHINEITHIKGKCGVVHTARILIGSGYGAVGPRGDASSLELLNRLLLHLSVSIQLMISRNEVNEPMSEAKIVVTDTAAKDEEEMKEVGGLELSVEDREAHNVLQMEIIECMGTLRKRINNAFIGIVGEKLGDASQQMHAMVFVLGKMDDFGRGEDTESMGQRRLLQCILAMAHHLRPLPTGRTLLPELIQPLVRTCKDDSVQLRMLAMECLTVILERASTAELEDATSVKWWQDVGPSVRLALFQACTARGNTPSSITAAYRLWDICFVRYREVEVVAAVPVLFRLQLLASETKPEDTLEMTEARSLCALVNMCMLRVAKLYDHAELEEYVQRVIRSQKEEGHAPQGLLLDEEKGLVEGTTSPSSPQKHGISTLLNREQVVELLCKVQLLQQQFAHSKDEASTPSVAETPHVGRHTPLVLAGRSSTGPKESKHVSLGDTLSLRDALSQQYDGQKQGRPTRWRRATMTVGMAKALSAISRPSSSDDVKVIRSASADVVRTRTLLAIITKDESHHQVQRRGVSQARAKLKQPVDVWVQGGVQMNQSVQQVLQQLKEGESDEEDEEVVLPFLTLLQPVDKQE